MLCIGHRGAMGYEPENTLRSIRKAIELGADWVEIDVYLVNDQLLVIHDDTLDRTTNGTGDLEDYSFEEIRVLDAGKGERIPTLQEVLDLTKRQVGLNIELKSVGAANAVVTLLAKLSKGHREKVLISSFMMDALKELVKLDSTLKIGVLASGNEQRSLKYAAELNAISIHFSREQVSRMCVDDAHLAGLLVYVYTVNEYTDLQRMRDLGVDGVYSNFPDRVRHYQ
ncbi:MAG: glycerophosphoryl diester phosphodiesterase [Cycloclasticus sp. symbiont of Bathymodiolus heckerae]|nr:MAG: glycerophosphoryl diester phosphodiesterase [Cycloclasticus sp. symbiont of Bathymodiolus heckerae]